MQEYNYKKNKELPQGCELCAKGEKLVLFITGLCSRGCFYCPLSDDKRGKDLIFANEFKAGVGRLTKKRIKMIFDEARICSAKGAGITGGDPVLAIDKTVLIIKKLKQEFSRKFHIHLYTSLKNITPEKLKKIYSAGLDEIRFHPDILNSNEWDKINLARKFDWKIGVEIPSIPNYKKETKTLLDFLNDKIDFLNINEFEISDTNANHLIKRGYTTKNRLSYAVLGSEKLALNLINYCRERRFGFNVHYCTAQFKDSVQMARRIKKRAKNTANKFDIITSQGLLRRGAIYLTELTPSFSYRKILNSLSKNKKRKIISQLMKTRKSVIDMLNLKDDEIIIDRNKLRLITSLQTIKKIMSKIKSKIKSKKVVLAIVEEYPTADAIEVDVRFLE